MEFFFILLVIGLVALAAARMNQLTKEVATVHCIRHKWVIDQDREMKCEICKARPE